VKTLIITLAIMLTIPAFFCACGSSDEDHGYVCWDGLLKPETTSDPYTDNYDITFTQDDELLFDNAANTPETKECDAHRFELSAVIYNNKLDDTLITFTSPLHSFSVRTDLEAGTYELTANDVNFNSMAVVDNSDCNVPADTEKHTYSSFIEGTLTITKSNFEGEMGADYTYSPSNSYLTGTIDIVYEVKQTSTSTTEFAPKTYHLVSNFDLGLILPPKSIGGCE
jgi:hypothetical protein